MHKRLALAFLALMLPAAFLGCPGSQGAQNGCPTGTSATDIFNTSCGSSLCHSAAAAQAGLDLVSPNVQTRLINVSSTLCPGHVLVVTPDSGFLFDKLQASPACGAQMPSNGLAPLSSVQITCIQGWLTQFFDGGA